MEADLLPNRVYYIVLRIRMGWWRARLHQVPLNPQSEMWQDALTWQKTLPNYKPDAAALAEIEAKNHDKITEYLQNYQNEVAGTKYVQYLKPEDGIPLE